MMSFIIIARCWSDKLKTISLWYYNIKSTFATGRLYIKYTIYRQGKDKEFSYELFFSGSTVPFPRICQNTWFFFSFSKSIDESTHIILTAFSHLNDRHVCLENYVDWQPYNGGSFFARYSALYYSSCHVLGKSNNVSAITSYYWNVCWDFFAS